MSKVKKSIYEVLKGGFLTDESAFKNWRMIIFIVALLLIMISNAHNADKKVLKISELNKLKRELKAAYIDTQTTLMRMKMESNIRAMGTKLEWNTPNTIHTAKSLYRIPGSALTKFTCRNYSRSFIEFPPEMSTMSRASGSACITSK